MPFDKDVDSSAYQMTTPARTRVATLAFLRSPLWLVFGLALLVRLAYLHEISSTPFWILEQWNQSDMDTFLQVARQILAGDLLVRNPHHPIHHWHLTIASEAQWREWYDPHVFYQMPGYYYVLALLLKLFGGSLVAVKITQCLLGALHAALLGAAAQRIMGRTGGLAVGTLAAVYGPFVAMEPMILRDSLGLLMATLSLWLVVHALDSEALGLDHRARLSWLGAGLVLGLGALIKDTGLILFAAIWLWLAARTPCRVPQSLRLAALLLPLGLAIGLLPFMLRNLALGVAPLAVSQQSAIIFVYGNIADSPSGGVLVGQTTPTLAPLLEQTQARPLPMILATLHTYDSSPSLLLANLWRKFSAIWSNVELPDNFSYAHIALHVPVLRALPRFVCVWLPALLGFMILAGRWHGGRRPCRTVGPTETRGPDRDTVPFPNAVLGLLLVVLAVHVVAQCFAPVMSRYRVVLLPFLMLPAGWLLAQGVTWIIHRRWTLLIRLLAGMGMLTLGWVAWPADPNLERAAVFPSHISTTAKLLLDQQKWTQAWDEFELGIGFFLEQGEIGDALQVRRGRLLLFTLLHRIDAVRGDWEILRDVLPRSDPVVRLVEQELYQRGGGAGAETQAPGPR